MRIRIRRIDFQNLVKIDFFVPKIHFNKDLISFPRDMGQIAENALSCNDEESLENSKICKQMQITSNI